MIRSAFLSKAFLDGVPSWKKSGSFATIGHAAFRNTMETADLLGGGFKNPRMAQEMQHSYLGKWSNFTKTFQMGWNHQPV